MDDQENVKTGPRITKETKNIWLKDCTNWESENWWCLTESERYEMNEATYLGKIIKKQLKRDASNCHSIKKGWLVL